MHKINANGEIKSKQKCMQSNWRVQTENKKKTNINMTREKFTIKTPFISAMIIYGFRVPKRVLVFNKNWK